MYVHSLVFHPDFLNPARLFCIQFFQPFLLYRLFSSKKFNFATHAVDTLKFNGNITYMFCIVRNFCFIMWAISCLSLFAFTAMAEDQAFSKARSDRSWRKSATSATVLRQKIKGGLRLDHISLIKQERLRVGHRVYRRTRATAFRGLEPRESGFGNAPKEKLPASVIGDFRRWIEVGPIGLKNRFQLGSSVSRSSFNLEKRRKSIGAGSPSLSLISRPCPERSP